LSDVIWANSALRDIDRHISYIAQFNPEAARRLARGLIAAGESLARLSQRGRPGQTKGSRELVVVWPYILVYRINQKTVEILRVWHGAQDRAE
jgi:addiction module RelE/StbE family toxin